MREIKRDEVIVGKYYYFYNGEQSYFGLGKVIDDEYYREAIRWRGARGSSGHGDHSDAEFGIIYSESVTDISTRFRFVRDVIFELTEDEMASALMDII